MKPARTNANSWVQDYSTRPTLITACKELELRLNPNREHMFPDAERAPMALWLMQW